MLSTKRPLGRLMFAGRCCISSISLSSFICSHPLELQHQSQRFKETEQTDKEARFSAGDASGALVAGCTKRKVVKYKRQFMGHTQTFQGDVALS